MTVDAVDDQAVANDDELTIEEDADATEVDVLANDTDVEGDPIEVTAVGDAEHGTVTLVDGVVTYTPNANYNGTDSFTYTVTDGATATVAVTVNAVDDKPVAHDDEVTVTEDDPAAVVDVLANDTDIDGGPKHVASVGAAAHGTVTLVDGVVSYRPNANHAGSDSFTYTVNGGSSATVDITVSAVDDAPVAVADSAAVAEDASATAINVLANDTDIDGGPKAIMSATNPAHGTVVITGGGSGLTYRPAANYNGADSFTYTLNGGSTATVSITVTAVDDAPVAVNDAYTVSEDSNATTLPVLANDADIDGGPKTITAVTQPANGTVTITGGGTGLTYKPATNYFTPLNTPSTFTYTLDGGSTATVSMTVSPVADNGASNNPTIEVGAETTVYKIGTAPVVIAPNLALTHPDWPSFSGATVRIPGTAQAGDVIGFVNQNGIVGSYSNGTLTLTGVASPAAYQAALRTVTFKATSTPETFPIVFTVTDGATPARSATDNRSVQITS
ncbi:Ig-like domain-containing protein [Nocardioides currus]|uniref:Tandem-95 repeat protein n=1 Tax=Nocardioides currus TaxID=2133958 RepID=A0A2R7YXR8_9ACTN|nr:Ig-like domain-containing protein [Nocardioides currus]PUA81131.1 hypothetical protein C7S10_08780 [Nocardioides currus]